MKKLATSFLLGAMIFSAVGVQARNVSEQEARAAAAYYFSLNCDRSVKAADLTLVNQIDNLELGVAECYMYNVSNDGWIIMTGTTAIEPVLAYSEESQLPEVYTELPSNMRWWVEGYAGMIGEIQAADVKEAFDDLDEWTDLLQQSYTSGPKAINYQFMSTKWNQGDGDNPTYNLLCPQKEKDGRMQYCPTGCVATAMAQIIRYWGSPIQPTGSWSYAWTTSTQLGLRFDTIRFNYSLMPNTLTDQYGNRLSSVTDEEVYQVALLGYAAGISVSMMYDVDGSAAFNRNAKNAFGKHFRFVKYPTLVDRHGNNDTAFIGRLRRNLINKCPVYMSGSSSTGDGVHSDGHAWVCSGYRVDTAVASNENKYYMNWGWGGSGNGWYNVVSNNMAISGMGYNFNQDQSIMVGIYPASADSTHINFLGIPEVEDRTELYSAYPNPANLVVTLPYAVTAATEMVVYSIDGKVIDTYRLQPGEGSVKVNVSNMPSGIYIYRVGGKSGKFMVQ